MKGKDCYVVTQSRPYPRQRRRARRVRHTKGKGQHVVLSFSGRQLGQHAVLPLPGLTRSNQRRLGRGAGACRRGCSWRRWRRSRTRGQAVPLGGCN